MNPFVTDVETAFGKVATRPVSITIDRTGITLPKGGHFQGIQRLILPATPPGRSVAVDLLVLTSSSDENGYYVACDMANGPLKWRARQPQFVSSKPLNHAGGCQVVGPYLVLGAEDHDHNKSSEIQFWNPVTNNPAPHPTWIPRQTAQYVTTAGAVGMTSLGRGSVLAVATYDADTVDFYTSPGDPFTGSPVDFKFTWQKSSANHAGWIDKNFGKYQNINLLTQSDGKVYMVAFDRDGYTDWMDLFRVDLGAGPDGALIKVAKKHMYCSDGCQFDFGAGIHIESASSFSVYAVNGYSGDAVTGTTIHANYFPGS